MTSKTSTIACTTASQTDLTAPTDRLTETPTYDSTLYTDHNIKMRRKAEVLKYKNNNNKLTKRQQWAALSNRSRQSIPDLTGVVKKGNAYVVQNCVNTTLIKYPSSASNVPGNTMLWFDNNTPFFKMNPYQSNAS